MYIGKRGIYETILKDVWRNKIATEIEYKSKQVSAFYRYDKRENIWMAVRRRHMKFTNTYRYCGIKAGNVLDSILNYFSVHD